MILVALRMLIEKGRAKENIDFNHFDDGTHTLPHRHKRDWSKNPPRQKPE